MSGRRVSAVPRREAQVPPGATRWAGWLGGVCLGGLVLATLLTVAACTEHDASVGRIPADQAAPALDNSSAQAALRSYWQRLDWYGGRFVVGRAQADPVGREELIKVMQPLVVGSVLDSIGSRLPRGERFVGVVGEQRVINEQTTDITTQLKSLTQHEAALTPTPVELFQGESFGGQFRYRMIKQNDGWKVAEVWRDDPGAEPRRIR